VWRQYRRAADFYREASSPWNAWPFHRGLDMACQRRQDAAEPLGGPSGVASRLRRWAIRAEIGVSTPIQSSRSSTGVNGK